MCIVKIVTGAYSGKLGVIEYDGLIHVHGCMAVLNPNSVKYTVLRNLMY